MTGTPPDNTPDPTDAAALITAFQAQITRIKAAVSEVENGGMPDVSALEEEVAALCALATSGQPQYTPETMRNMRALMAIMIDRLETLARRIKEHHDGNTAPS